jgi:multiple sugar transport system permease protein
MKKKLNKTFFYLFIIILCSIAIFPFYWMVNTSLQQQKVIYSSPPDFIPGIKGLKNYIEIFADPIRPLFKWILNSIIVGLLTSIACVGLAIWASYSISSFRFKGKNVVFYALMVTQMLPPILVIVPIFMIFARLKLTDSTMGIILVNMCFLVPPCIWFLRGFIDSIPPDLESAAMVDGCNRIGAFLRVTLPLLLPGIAATFTFTFLVVWDEYLFARILLKSPQKWLASVGVASYIGQFVTPWNEIMSAATIVSLPAILLFVFFQRYLISGLTGGAVKE